MLIQFYGNINLCKEDNCFKKKDSLQDKIKEVINDYMIHEIF